MAIRSVVDTRFPLAKHSLIGLFIVLDFTLVFQLGEFGGSLFVHLLLEVGALDAVLLVHLLENVHLVVLSRSSLLGGSGLKLCVLLANGSVNLLLLVSLEPIGLTFLLLLEQDVLLTSNVDVLHQIDACLSLPLPLGLTHLVLPVGFG